MLSLPGPSVAPWVHFEHLIADMMLNIGCRASILWCIAHTACLFSRIQFYFSYFLCNFLLFGHWISTIAQHGRTVIRLCLLQTYVLSLSSPTLLQEFTDHREYLHFFQCSSWLVEWCWEKSGLHLDPKLSHWLKVLLMGTLFIT